jgi:hypothetical protein
LADNGIEKLMKKVVGKAEAEDALQILDLLTKEENLTMMMARNLEDTHHFDDEATIFEESFQDVHDNVRATQEVFCDVGSDVKDTNLDVIKRDLRNVHDSVKATKPGMPHPFNFLTLSSSIVVAETCAQGTSRVRSFEYGSLLRILPSTITPHVTASTTALQSGL